MTAFRCATASRARGDELAGTASTVRSYLLVEHPGPWGTDALRDARLPDGLGDHLQEQSRRHRVRVLLVRRPGRRAGDGPTRVVAARAAGAASWAEAADLDRIDDVRDLDLAALGAGRSLGLEPEDAPVLAVCTHGRHDACCAELGRPVALELASGPHAPAVWEASHVGGDRFAGNLVCLPEGLYFGRVDPGDARQVLAEYLDGRITLEHYRGRSCHSFPQQAAERLVRERTGLREIDAVRFVSMQRDDAHAWTVQFRAGADELVASVVREEGAPAFLTCDAKAERRPRRFVATLVS